MEYDEVQEGTGKVERNRRQERGVDLWVTRWGEAVLQLQHREELGGGWAVERAVQLQSDRAVWMEPGWKGRYRVAAGGAAVVGVAHDVVDGPGRGGAGKKGVGRAAARRRNEHKQGARTLHKGRIGLGAYYARAQKAGGGVHILGEDDPEGGRGHENGAG